MMGFEPWSSIICSQLPRYILGVSAPGQWVSHALALQLEGNAKFLQTNGNHIFLGGML